MSNAPNSTGAVESPSQGNVIAPNGGPSTGTKTGFPVYIALDVMLIGILAWLIFQCCPSNRNRNKRRKIDLESKKAVELEGDALVELPAEPCR